MAVKVRAIALATAAVGVVIAIVLVRRGVPERTPAAVVAAARDAGQSSPARICDELRPTLGRLPGMNIGATRLVDLDSAWRGTGSRPACQVAMNGRLPSRFAASDSLEGWLDSSGWRAITAYDADGPDGHVSSRYRNGAMCILSFHWDGPDDSDSTSTVVLDDSTDVEITCAKAVPADTTR